MRKNFAWAVSGALLVLLSLKAAGSGPQATPAGTIACRVLEAHVVANLGVTVAIFHQRDEAARDTLGELVRQHSGAAVEFQTHDDQWHPATLFRLKSCFGRGLLVFSSASGRLEDKEEFMLRVREGG